MSKGCLLIVEDNELNRDMLSRRLRRLDYEVLQAANGTDGVEMAIQHKPDLILLDLRMPGMDGAQVTKLLKSEETTKQIPIVVLTAHAFEEAQKNVWEAGCDALETKPIDFDHLTRTIERFLS